MVGTGRQAYHVNLPTLLGFPEVRIVVVCDVDRHGTEAAKEKVDKYYGSNRLQDLWLGPAHSGNTRSTACIPVIT